MVDATSLLPKLTTDPQALYIELGHLIASMPDLTANGELPVSTRQWLGRAYALVKETAFAEALALDHHIKNLENPQWRKATLGPIQNILYRALALAEVKAPATAQGAFIPAGNVLQAMSAIGKVLETARRDVLIVDPYMDVKTITDFAVLAPSGVALRLLADAKEHRSTLKPAVERWIAQYGDKRPVSARLSAARSLHDRLIAIDGAQVWVLTQSLNGIAVRSPATIVRVDAETAGLKVEAYTSLWEAAAPL